MANIRYIQIQDLIFDTYILNCPVEIEKGALLLDQRTRAILLQLRLNILKYDVRDISSITINIECMDDAGEIIADINPHTHTYRDVHLLDGRTLGEKTPIILDQRVRKVNVRIEKVVLTNGSVWVYSGGEIKLQPQGEVSTLDVPLKTQLDRDVSSLAEQKKKRIKFFPQQFDNFWFCTCGRPNANDTDNCVRCVFLKSWVFETINVQNIQKHYEEHLAEIRKKEEEERFRVEAESVRREKRRKRIRNIALAVISLITTVLLIIYVLVPFTKYSQATKMLSKKEFDKAITVFTSLGTYKDSSDMVFESSYQKAGELLSEKKFDEAAKIYLSLGEYKNSSELEKETQYQKANVLLENEKYDEAITTFVKIIDYEDSKELINEANYQKAINLLSTKQYREAMDIFNKIPDYKDSKDQSKEATYQLANVYLLDKNFGEATTLFKSLLYYKNAKEMVKEAVYLQAKEMLSREDFEGAITSLLQIFDYKDSKEIINKTRYEWGNQLVIERQFYNAINILEKVDSTVYPDVTERIKNATYEFAKQKAAIGDYKQAYYLIEKLDYKDSETLTKEYEKKAFAWSVDGGMSKSYYGRFDTFLVRFVIHGGKSNETIKVSVYWYIPNADTYKCNDVVTMGDYQDYESSCRFEKGADYSQTGNASVTVSNYTTGERLARYEFIITY